VSRSGSRSVVPPNCTNFWEILPWSDFVVIKQPGVNWSAELTAWEWGLIVDCEGANGLPIRTSHQCCAPFF
jgi:hypothetical protein